MDRLGRYITYDPFFWVFAALSFGAAGFLVIIGRAEAFDRFLGQLPPLSVVLLAIFLGGTALRFLSSRGWCPDRSTPIRARAVWEPATTALIFAAAAVAADVAIGFRQDMNIGWPVSVLFYPAIGFVAEVVFHLTPLAAFIGVLGWQFDSHASSRRVWIAVSVVALVETVFQTLAALAGPEPVIALFVAPHLFLIGAYELVALRRFGFAAIFSFRLAYYLLWHIIWGHLRLSLLF